MHAYGILWGSSRFHGILLYFPYPSHTPRGKNGSKKNGEKPASGKSKGSDAWKRSETSRQRKSIEMHPSKSRVTRYVGMVCFLFISFLFSSYICLCLLLKKLGMWRYLPTQSDQVDEISSRSTIDY